MTDFFSRLARWSADLLGSWQAFILATFGTLIWFVSGPVFGWSDTWQLVVNTATTVLTFLAVFLIQHAQNRDAKAVQVKLDELLVKLDKPDTAIAGIEQRTNAEIEEAERALRHAADEAARARSTDRSPRGRAALAQETMRAASGERPSSPRLRWSRMTG